MLTRNKTIIKILKWWRSIWYEKVPTTKVISFHKDTNPEDKWFKKTWKWYRKDVNDFVEIIIEDPLKEWRKAKGLFIKPKCSFRFFNNINSNCPYVYIPNVPSILCVRSCSVGWKNKYNSPRHEQDPYVWVCFFRKFGFSMTWSLSKDSFEDCICWEYLLDYIYFRKDITIYDKWRNIDKKVVNTPSIALTKKGKILFNQKYKKK